MVAIINYLYVCLTWRSSYESLTGNSEHSKIDLQANFIVHAKYSSFIILWTIFLNRKPPLVDSNIVKLKFIDENTEKHNHKPAEYLPISHHFNEYSNFSGTEHATAVNIRDLDNFLMNTGYSIIYN